MVCEFIWIRMEAVFIEKEALRLSDIERAVLADRLLESLFRTSADLEEEWIHEAESRMLGFREKRIAAISGPEAMSDSRREFPR